MKTLTQKQANIVTGYTGLLACEWGAFHKDVEIRLNRPVFTHEFASQKFWDELREVYKEDFLAICCKD